MKSLKWLQSETVTFEADSDVEEEEKLIKGVESMSLSENVPDFSDVDVSDWQETDFEEWLEATQHLVDDYADVDVSKWEVGDFDEYEDVDVSNWTSEDFDV